MEHRSSINGLRVVRPAEPSVPDSQPGVMIRREQIINAVNRINFHNGRVFVTLKHRRFNSFINVAAQPQPCRDEFLDCNGAIRRRGERQLNNYEYLEFFYTDGMKRSRWRQNCCCGSTTKVSPCGCPRPVIDLNHRIAGDLPATRRSGLRSSRAGWSWKDG